jgi:phage terminase large subunit-like protein
MTAAVARPSSAARQLPNRIRADVTAAERRARMEALLAEDEADRRAAKARLLRWAYRYMPEAFSAAPAPFQAEIAADLDAMVMQRPIAGRVQDSYALACPRGHGKTTLMKAFLLRVIHEWREMPHFRGRPPFIVVVSDTASLAEAIVSDLRAELESNDDLRRDYGSLVPAAGRSKGKSQKPWGTKLFETSDGVLVRALGAGGQIRGVNRRNRRPTLILVDDLENDLDVRSKDARAELHRWLNEVLIPLGIEGHLLTCMIGTVLHQDSLLANLIDREKSPEWWSRRYAARWRMVDGANVPSIDGDHILMPDYWSADALAARRRKIGSLAFQREYLNQPIDDATAMFQWGWLQGAKARGRGRGFAYEALRSITLDLALSSWDALDLAAEAGEAEYQVTITAWDLAIVDTSAAAERADSDYTVGVTVGLTLDDRIEVRRIWRGRGLTPSAIRARIIDEAEAIRPGYVIVENNAAQRAFEVDLREPLARLGIPLRGHTTTKRKSSLYEGVPSMSALFEGGLLSFAWSTPAEEKRVDRVIAELHGLGREAHDDCVMALWMAVAALRRWVRSRDAERRRQIGTRPAAVGDSWADADREDRAAA